VLPVQSARTIQKSEALTARRETIEHVLETQRGDSKKNTYLPLGNYQCRRPTSQKTAYSAPSSTGRIAAVARCRLQPDGHEDDGVFTLDEFRGRGTCPARRAGMKSTPAGMKSCTCSSTLCNTSTSTRPLGSSPFPRTSCPRMIR